MSEFTEEQTNPAFKVRIVVLDGPTPGASYDVTRFPAVVGRSRDCDVALDDDPEDPRLSRKHARVSIQGGSMALEDLSTNGTWVGDRKVGAGQTVVLGEEAVVRLGPRVVLRLQVVPDIPEGDVPVARSPEPKGGWLQRLLPQRASAGVHVEVRALGAFNVTAAGVAIPGDLWQHRKAVVMLVYLADTGTPVSADRLSEVLWPDASDGRQTVQTAVSRIRKAMRTAGNDLVFFERKLYQIDASCSLWYDVAEFEQWAREGQRLWATRDVEGAGRALECAVDLYGGPFLEGHDEGWVDRRRTYLERAWYEAMEMLGAVRLEEQRADEAARVFQRVLEADPLREAAHLGLVRSLASQGKRDDAVRQCTESITSLKKLLNLPPSAEMEALYRSLTQSPS